MIQALEEADKDTLPDFPAVDVPKMSPKFHQVVSVLMGNPILVAPCLQWLQEKQAAIADCTLKHLYDDETLARMKAEAAEDVT